MKAWQYLQELCKLPPRGSATESERQAAEWLGDRLQHLGYDVDTQRFRSPRHTLYAGPLMVMVLLLAAIWLLAGWPLIAAVLAVATLIPLIGEMLGSRVNFNLILPKRESQNVVAQMKPVDKPSSDPPDLVIVAHYDTQWGSWLFSPAFRPFLRPFFLVTYAGLVLAVVGLVLRAVLGAAPWIEGMLTAATAIVSITGLYLLLSLVTGRPVLGANDNGSGVAVALALADRWRAEGPTTLNPVFVFTGCEEVGLRGMHHYLAAARPKPGTRFVNLDNVGGGTLRYLLGEGMLGYQRYDEEMLGVAERLGESYMGKVAPLKNLLLPTDALLAAKAGYKAITFLAAGEGEAIPHYHWHTDTLENVDPAVVQLTERFVMEFVGELGKGQAGETRTEARPAGGR